MDRAKELQYMRFLLSPPPEDEEMMETRSWVNPPEQRKQEVLPIAPKEEEVKFGSGNNWR